LIVFAVIAFDVDTPFPGWRAAIPCGWAAAIITAGSYGPRLVARLLMLGAEDFVGRNRYSLYQEHQMVIAVQRRFFAGGLRHLFRQAAKLALASLK
jgi:peptidoglycan/LPS O-acetylase OafA/YrhL